MSTKYNEYKELNFAKVAEEVLAFWDQEKIFEKSVTNHEGKKTFTFYEGPPSANGTPGIHHVMARTVKDIFCRFKTLQGYQVKRKGGWDTHGLPVELQVEKELGITKDDIGKKISIEAYNIKCRETVMKYKDQWDDLTVKMGYWVDLEHPYVTYNNEYIETLWWILKQFHEKKLLYKGYSIQPYSPSDGTGLSSHELNQPGCYKNVKDTSVVAQFKVKRDAKSEFLFNKNQNREVFILAWTTTPWTLPANTALAIGANIDYVKIATANPYTNDPVEVILAETSAIRYFSDEVKHLKILPLKEQLEENAGLFQFGKQNISYYVTGKFKGKDLLDLRYEQLMPYLQPLWGGDSAFQVVEGDFVTTEDGTGVVHISPTFGADDFRVARQHGIPPLTIQDDDGNEVPIVDKKGKFVNEVGIKLLDGIVEYRIKTHKLILSADNFYVKNYMDEDETHPDYKSTDVIISIILKEQNKAFKVEKYEHSYPHSWRTDKPILYYPLDAWFIKTTSMKDEMVKLNKTINWKPESTGTGRFGNWLENLVDWNLSRSRFWGTPLPIWTRSTFSTESGELERICIESLSDLKNGGYLINVADIAERIRLGEKVVINQILEYFHGKRKFIFANEAHAKNALDRLLDLAHHGSVGLKDLIQKLPHPELLKEWGTPLDSIEGPIDLHKPIVDNILLIRSSDNHPDRENYFYREPDLIDVWFDSGAMPYAQWGLNAEKLKAGDPKPFNDGWNGAFPADFISEGVDQTRGWFFTLHVIAALLFDSVAFKNVLSTGLVLDKEGNKMSKRKGNVVNPFETLEKFGPDVVRWYLMENAPPWDNLKFDMAGLVETQRRFFGTLMNTYSFFALYANIDGFVKDEMKNVPYNKLTTLDRWIISKLQTLIEEVTAAYNDYDPTKASRAIQEFVNDHLSNWYVRLNRKRFWQPGTYAETPAGKSIELTDDKKGAYETLYGCIMVVGQLMAPIAPFYSERLYKDLTDNIRDKAVKNKTPLRFESVHHTDLTVVEKSMIDKELELSMEYAQRICSLVHSIRKNSKIKVRTPLQKVLLPVLDERFAYRIKGVEEIIKSEVNVKAIEYIDDASGLLVKKARPNFAKLGKQYGPRVKDVTAVINLLSKEEISIIEKKGTLSKGGFELVLEDLLIGSEDIPGWSVATEGGLTVALDISITDNLKKEGIARDFVNRVQNIRKDMGLEVLDKIGIEVEKDGELATSALTEFNDYIRTETQALSLELKERVAEGTELDMDEFVLKVKVSLMK